MSRENKLLILGASVRAAAFSALAAGLEPICGDAFADADLRQACQATVATPYPTGLIEIAHAAQPGPWMFTGALENQPELIARISAERPLLGNGPQAISGVRDPFAVARALAAAGLSSPALRRTSAGLARDGSWLRKPLKSSGGAGIIPWANSADDDRTAAKPNRGSRYYFQQRISGRSCAAIYLAAAGASQLLGASEQLLRAGAPDSLFCYAGSVGPLPLSTDAADRLRRIGEVLTAEFQLVGLLGVDYIDDGQDVWPVEVNPRYTASVEILERGLQFSAVGWHIAACCEGRLPGDAIRPDELRRGGSPHWRAKRILFARRKSVVDQPTAEALLASSQRDGFPTIADIPCAGAKLLPGWPILTLFGRGASREEALAEIDHSSATLADRLPI
ncbi:MAG TPA: ATP-grasp domain-containing protein [Pirellulales bacterium]|jgi:predicted ATP-grasp superfamily ATP-dependent carboligase